MTTGCELVEAMNLAGLRPLDADRADDEWAKLWDTRWAEVDNWWRGYHVMHEDDVGPLRDLLDALRRHIPATWVENGTEREQVPTDPKTVKTYLRGGAKILWIGELECIAGGEDYLSPPEIEWPSVASDVEAEMLELAEAPEVTEGDVSLSRRSHAKQALDALRGVRMVSAAILDVDAGDADADGLDRLSELVAELSHLAFSVGIHARAAMGKETERFAVLGKAEAPIVRARRDGAATGGAEKAKRHREAREPILQAMLKRISAGQGVTDAARKAFKIDGLGTSGEANRRLWYDHAKN